MRDVFFIFTFLELDTPQVLGECILNNELSGTPGSYIDKIRC